MTKMFIWVGITIGSTVGGFLPTLWGDDVLSAAGIILSTVGGVAVAIGGYELAQSIG